MGIFFIIAYSLSFLVFAWISKWIPQNINKLCQCLFVFIMLFVFFCLRDLTVLNDTSHYYEDFMFRISYSNYFTESLLHIDKWERFEPGYLIYMKLIARYVWNNPYAVIFVTGILLTVANIILVSKFTNKICLVFFFLFVSQSLFSQYSAIRQGIAAIFFYYAFFKLIKRQYILYILIVIFAMTFHFSAVVLLIPLVLSHIRYNRTNLFLLIIVSVIIMGNIYELMHYYGSNFYLEMQEERSRLPLAGLVGFVITCMVMYFSYQLKKEYKLEIANEKAFWGISIYMAAMQLIALQMLVLSRCSIYFSPFLYIMYFSYYNQACDKSIAKRQLKLLSVFLFAFMMVVLIYRTNWHHIIPYSFYDFDALYHETRFGEGYDY